MSLFIKELLKHTFFISMLTSDQLNIHEFKDDPNYSIFTKNGFSISQITLMNSIVFENIYVSSSNNSFALSLRTKESDVYFNCDKYFNSINNTNQELNKFIIKSGNKKRKYSDNTAGYNIHISIRPTLEDYLITLILKKM